MYPLLEIQRGKVAVEVFGCEIIGHRCVSLVGEHSQTTFLSVSVNLRNPRALSLLNALIGHTLIFGGHTGPFRDVPCVLLTGGYSQIFFAVVLSFSALGWSISFPLGAFLTSSPSLTINLKWNSVANTVSLLYAGGMAAVLLRHLEGSFLRRNR